MNNKRKRRKKKQKKKKNHQQHMLARIWGKRNPNPLLMRMKAGTTTLEKNWRFLKNLNIDLPYDPAIPLLGIYPKE
jgi:hypothetical protein